MAELVQNDALASCRFRVNDRVRVCWRGRQGQVGRVVQRQLARVYRVRFDDGAELFFGQDGIERCTEPADPCRN